MKKILLILILSLVSLSSFAATEKKPEYSEVVTQMTQLGNDALAQYNAADAQSGMAVMDSFSRLYFDYYEGSGMELAVAAISPNINAKTEALFTQIIGSASKNDDPTQIQKKWAALKVRLSADVDLIKGNVANSFIEAFLQSFSILLREGFEALIIVTALLTYLRRSHHESKVKVVYSGVGLALLASVLTAFLFTTIFKTFGSNREAMEGIVMLVASTVMFYVSYWLFAKREAAKWQGFIKNKMSQALTTSNMFTLGFTAFLAVYREGAETILFYQALMIGSKGQTMGIFAGLAAAGAALFALYFAIQKASIKIPYRLFFTVTALFLYYMAFSFIGRGILELQQAGWIDITPISGFPQIEWLGIFPAWQNVGMQLVFLVPTAGIFAVWYLSRFFKRSSELK